MTSHSKKAFPLLVSLALALSSGASASAANLANSKCPSAGKKTAIAGAKYICTKSGKKLIWKKAVAKEAVSTVNQSDEITKLEAIYDSLKPKIAEAAPTYEYTHFVDPLLKDSAWTKESLASTETARKLLAVLGVPPTKKLQIYFSWGLDFAKPTLPSYCQTSTSPGGYCGQTGIIFTNNKSFATDWGYGGEEKPYKSEMDKFSITANVAHEIGHYGQDASANNPEYWLYTPGWFREGGAEYFKFLAYAYDNRVTYKYLHDLYVAAGTERCVNYPLLGMSKEGSNSNGCEYTKGLFAIEYLVLKTGNPSAIFALNKTIGEDTATIFKNAYGFTLESFGKEVDAYFSSVIAASKK